VGCAGNASSVLPNTWSTLLELMDDFLTVLVSLMLAST